jgi:hypothetical protein
MTPSDKKLLAEAQAAADRLIGKVDMRRNWPVIDKQHERAWRAAAGCTVPVPRLSAKAYVAPLRDSGRSKQIRAIIEQRCATAAAQHIDPSAASSLPPAGW